MAVSLLEILRSVPDHRRREGLRFELATVVLYAILGMVAGANSYRQLHEFVNAHRQRLNKAFNLSLRYAPSYSGLRLILQGIEFNGSGGRVSPPCRVAANAAIARGAHGDCR